MSRIHHNPRASVAAAEPSAETVERVAALLEGAFDAAWPGALKAGGYASQKRRDARRRRQIFRPLARLLLAQIAAGQRDAYALCGLPRAYERVVRALVSRPAPSGGAVRMATVVEMTDYLRVREERALRPSCRATRERAAKEGQEAAVAILAEVDADQRAALGEVA